MAADSSVLADVAGAILDGLPIDWASAESSADEPERQLLHPLRLVAKLADLHRRHVHSATGSAAAEVEPEAATRFEYWGHLRVLEPIGRGAFGEVYRAWDTRLDREVALKLLPATAGSVRRATSIIEEGRLLARIRHPNVVTIYGAERIDDRVGLWMEFIKGRTLEQVIEHGHAFGASEATEIGIQLCHAVAAVHGAGLVHRDVKAHNVMLADDRRVVLMDFGTGRELRDLSGTGLTGTPLYLAPEVLGGAEATVRSDIYSVGVLLYHLLTRSYPVRASNFRDLRLAHERGERTDLRTARPDLSPRLIRVVDRAIDSQPERRPQNASALAAELVAVKARPTLVPLAYAAAVAAAIALVVWTATGLRRSQPLGEPRDRGVVTTAATATIPAGRPIIAVLPLKNLSAEPNSDYFVDGLTDELIRNLAVIEGLDVRSQTSSFAFKDKPRNLREVGEQLGANLVVEGSVLRAGNRLRINAQLVQVAGDVPLWAERFDRELNDIFAIQDEISRAIVNKLRLTLGRGQRRYDTNLDAYELYLKARALVDRRGVVNAQNAAELFGQVIAKDSAFAPAHAGLANAYAFMSIPSYQGIPFETAYSIMRPAAVKAFQLDPLLAEALAAMGWVYSYERDWPNAEKAFQRAIELNPSLTQTYTSYSISTLQPLGRFGEALRLLQVASRNDPMSLDVLREIGEVELFAGRYEEAIDTLQRVRVADPDFPFVDTFLARALTFAGRPAEAFPPVEKSHWSMAHAYVMTGRRVEAEALAASNKGNPYAEAMIYAALGDMDRAFEAVERTAVSQPQRVGRLLIAPEMVALRGDPRLVTFRKKFGLP